MWPGGIGRTRCSTNYLNKRRNSDAALIVPRQIGKRHGTVPHGSPRFVGRNEKSLRAKKLSVSVSRVVNGDTVKNEDGFSTEWTNFGGKNTDVSR